ncbi:hypothetical protein [Soonwooa sp.]|uniref:hypothetical protein n=1 Tax=Soonwooa sp. TaxID=1938592 RepID=UPI0028A9EFC9|nr:hypothetical protein [Soonwooa sp.]
MKTILTFIFIGIGVTIAAQETPKKDSVKILEAKPFTKSPKLSNSNPFYKNIDSAKASQYKMLNKKPKSENYSSFKKQSKVELTAPSLKLKDLKEKSDK